jgi:hypothetical protein
MTDYQMPAVSLGDWVYFYAHENADPTIALVSKVGRRALELWAISPGYGGTDKPSVHHKDDPGFNEFPAWKETGAWEHRPDDPRISILSERVALLEKKIAAIEPKKKATS